MALVPKDFLRIKKQVLPSKIAGYSCNAKKGYAGNDCQGESLQQALSEKHQKGAAGAIAEQGKAYDHVGKMVILDNGKEAHEENFVSKRHC